MSPQPPPTPRESDADRLADLALGQAEGRGSDADATPLRLAAAALDIALSGPRAHEPPPDTLSARLEAAADGHGRARPRRRLAPAVLGWAGWVAAALLLAFVAAGRWRVLPPPGRAPSLVERLAGVGSRAMTATDHPLAKGAAGDLVWSAGRQEGFMAIRGLAEVDPKRGVYQLWIFDASRDERFPVDGGTFTVRDAAATTFVPFRPALPIGTATLFAVTLEPPGGVVVSDRKRILLTAAVSPD